MGYEFRFKYTSQWNASTSKAVEMFNAYKCEDSDWKVSDIKLSAWKKKMCSDIGGPMLAVKKADLARFPTLYDSTKDLRIYVATIGNSGNITSPTDNAGPGWTTPGSVDFEIKSAFDYGADSAKFEDILKNGYVQGEDCFMSGDEDGDGTSDCSDWDCQYSSKCSGMGVNAVNYTDTSSPLVTGVKIEEYTNAALIMYDTNKPTNGTLELYGYGDTQCLNKTNDIYDIGILKPSSIRAYKTWHTAVIYETSDTIGGKNVSINWPLVAGSSYNYKIKVCDANGKCAISRCSSFKTASTSQKCSYCNFVTRIKAPSGWSVAYDVNRDGIYEHVQGAVCGPNAGMKTNYTSGRKVNIKIYNSDSSVYIEFLNASLTKSGLNDKVSTVSSSGSIIHDTTKNIVGLNSETRDKIVNNLHPEACRIKIPLASGAVCNTLYHCDDNGANCVDRTVAAGGAPVDAANCVWNVPYCEFSTYKTSDASGGTTTAGGGGGGSASSSGLGEITGEKSFDIDLYQNVNFNVSGAEHTITLKNMTNTSITVSIKSVAQIATLSIEESRNIDLDSDGTADISVKLNSINYNGKFAKLTISKISSATGTSQADGSIGTGNAVDGGSQSGETSQTSAGAGNLGIVILIVLVILAVIAVVIILAIKYYNR
ncbi:hypothetical protein HYW76_04885 [Candidatus Pacearchaeota archaeon]|nr:hypothetical protein [Candidatus Pacearchaeota archaeon]